MKKSVLFLWFNMDKPINKCYYMMLSIANSDFVILLLI